MYERTYGYLYDRDRLVKDDAALIRRTIKTLAKGDLLPADWVYSVRYRTFAGGRAIDISARSPRPVTLMESGYVRASDTKPRRVIVPRRLDIDDTSLADDERWINLWLRPGEQHEIRWCDTSTSEARAVHRALSDLHDGCNHDGSDSMTDYFDVKFYGSVSIDTLPGVPRAQRARPSWLPGGSH